MILRGAIVADLALITDAYKFKKIFLRWECGVLELIDNEELGQMATIAFRIIASTGRGSVSGTGKGTGTSTGIGTGTGTGTGRYRYR